MTRVIGAVDIGGTKIAVGLVDENGEVLARRAFSSSPSLTPDRGLEEIRDLLSGCLAETGASLEGVGIGCTGPVDPLEGLLLSNKFLPEWSGLDLVRRMRDTLHVGAAIENDGDAAALGVVRWGVGRGRRRVLYVTVSTGIGGGLVIDNALYRGVDNAHPEIGHHVINPAGPLCFCGARGCWERMASGTAMAEWYNTHLPSPISPPLDARRVCVLAEADEPLAREAVAREAFYLGLGFANLVTLFAPDVIALGGGVMQSWSLFEPRVREIIEQTCRLVPAHKTRLLAGGLADAGLVGAAAVWACRHSPS